MLTLSNTTRCSSCIHSIAHSAPPSKPPKTPSQVFPGLMDGASLRANNFPPNMRPEKYAPMSATHTRTITEKRKLMPMTRAWVTASQAAHKQDTPTNQRTALGTDTQAAAPRPNSQLPPKTQTAVPASHRPPARTSPALQYRDAAHTTPQTAPVAQAPAEPNWFNRAHSQPPAAISSVATAANATG